MVEIPEDILFNFQTLDGRDGIQMLDGNEIVTVLVARTGGEFTGHGVYLPTLDGFDDIEIYWHIFMDDEGALVLVPTKKPIETY